MSFVTWKIDYEKKLEGGSYLPSESLERFTDPIITVNIGNKKDSWNFKSVNFNTDNDNKFNPNDRITISRAYNSSVVTPDNLIMEGIIQDSPSSVTFNKDESTVKGFNYSEAVARALVFIDASGKTVDEALQLALTKAGGGTLVVEWDSNNPSKKRDGVTDFPLVTEKWFNWPLKKILEQYSTDKYTGDGQYYWYITKENKLRWYSRFDAAFNQGKEFDSSIDEYISIKDGKDISNVKNHIINKGGTTPSGNPIRFIKQDYASINKHGRKFFINVSKATNAETINAQDMKESWGDLYDATKRFPNTYPFTTTWVSNLTATINGINMVKGSVVVIPSSGTSDADYNAVLRTNVRSLLEDECDEILTNTKYGRLKIDITFKAGSKGWELGETIGVVSPKTFDGRKTLRIVEIQYSTTTDMFSLEEDFGTI
jgi:hypothetical protein